MVSYKAARVLQVTFLVIVATVILLGVFFIGNFLTNNSNTVIVDKGQEALLKTSEGYEVSALVRGPIVADEDFRSYKITISNSQRELVTYKGYDNQKLDTIKLDNSVAAYEQFVYALNNLGFMNGSGDTDNKGFCSDGYVYEFNTIKDDKVVKSLWSSSCGSRSGTFRGSVRSTFNLFINQIDGGEELIQKLW